MRRRVGHIDRGGARRSRRPRGRPPRSRASRSRLRADQPEHDLRPGIGPGQRGAQPARRAGDDDDPERCPHRRGRFANRRGAGTAAGARRQHRATARRGAAATACPASAAQRPAGRPPQFRAVEPLDDDFRPARQPGHRIEIARIEDQRAGHELLQGQPPAAIESGADRWSAPSRHKMAARKPRPASPRSNASNPASEVNVCSSSTSASSAAVETSRHDDIGKAPRRVSGTAPLAVAGYDVGVRLVQDECIGVGGAHPRQQLEIGAHLAGRRSGPTDRPRPAPAPGCGDRSGGPCRSRRVAGRRDCIW